MTWTEIKMDKFDFCIMSGKYMVGRKGEQVELYYLTDTYYRIGWHNSVEEGMFNAWISNLKNRRRNEHY